MDKNPNLILESEIPENWQEVEAKAIVPSVPPAAISSTPIVLPPYFRGSIPANLQHDAYLVGTDKNPRVATSPIMPTAPSANPQNNAAIQSSIIINKAGSTTTTTGLRFRGTWNAFTAYAINDVVLDNNSAYVAITGSVNLEPDQGNSANWSLLGKNLNFRGLWVAPTPPVIRQSATQAASNGIPIGKAFTSNLLAGSKIIVSVMSENIGNNTIPVITDTQGNVYSQVVASTRINGNQYQIQTWIATAQTGPCSVTVTWTNGTTPGFGYMFISEITGTSGVDQATSAAQGVSSSGPYPALSLPVNFNSDLLYTAVFADNGTPGTPSGFTTFFNGPNNGIATEADTGPTGTTVIQWGGSFSGGGSRFMATAVSLIPALAGGAFNYNPYDVVEFNGSMWLCVVSTNFSPMAVPSSWVLFAQSTGLAQIKTVSYLAVSGDEGTLLSFNSSSALTLTLPATPPDTGWWINVENIGTGVLTINPNGLSLDGVSGNLTLTQNQGMAIFTDGTNYFTFRGSSAIGGVSVKTVSYASVASDSGTLLSFNGSNLTLTLSSPPPNAKWMVFVQNLNSTNLTINPNGLNLDGSGSSITLGQNQGITIFTDGTNYFTLHGVNRLTVPSILTASAPDGSGNVNIGLANENAKTALMGPVACSAAAAPTFRQPQGTDLLNLNIASAFAINSAVNQSGNLRLCGAVLPAGLYRVSMYVVVTVTGAGNISMTITWNDGTASQTFSPSNISTTVLGTIAQFDIVVLSDGIHDITYAVNLI